MIHSFAVCAFACALQASAAEGEFALRECDFRGDHSVINLSHRTASGYAAFDSDKARRGSVTVFVKPGEKPWVTFSCCYDSVTVERRFGRGTDKVITVDGATWEGPPDSTSRTFSGWKVPVKPGWNDVNVRVTVLSNKQPVGELTQAFRIYAYVFEVQPAGQLEHPLPAETGNFFLEHPLVDAAGNLYVGARRGGGTALLRYDPSGRISVRYDIKSAMAIGGPMGVDDDGNLYAFIAENIVQFDRDGKFVKSVAALGWTANTATAEDLKTGTWPSRRGEDRRDEVLRQISPCASNWETAMAGDAIYFIAHTPENRNCSEGPHVLACVTVDGRAQILDKVTPASGVIRGPDGNLYMREAGKDENHGLLTYSPTGRLEQRRPIIGPRYQVFHGIDGAGFVYAGGHVWEPSLTSVKQSADVTNGRFRSVSQRRGPSYYLDLLTGQQSTSNSGHNDLASWMYRGAIFTAYAADLRIARAVSLAPGAAGAAPLPMLKRGKSRPSVASGATASQQGAVPPGQTTAVPPAAQPAGTQAGVPASQTQPAGASGALPGAATDTARAAESGEISDGSQPVEPESAAAAALAASAAAAAGAWLTLLTSGMRWRDVMEGLRGMGAGEPVTVPPPPQPPPVIPQQVHRDGEVNEQGDVWSAEDRGWIARDQYERNAKRRQWLADKAVADRQAGQSEDVKQAYDKWQDSNQKLAEVQEQGRLLEKKEKLREWVEQSEKASAEQSYWSDVKNNFVLNVEKEFNELPEQTFELCREAAKVAKAGVDAAVDLARDATNWEILRATGAQTAKDLIGSPIQSFKKVNKFYTETAKKVGGAAVQMVAHPVDTLKAVTGYENWAKALDPNVPLAKRMGYALMGTVDTVSTFGGALVTKPGAAALRGVEAADKLVDAAKAEMLANKLDDVARLGGDDLARHEAWMAGEQQARDRVAKLSAANTKQEVRAAVLEIQGDKRAIQMMNRQGKGMKGAFNEEIRGIYKQTDAAVEKRLKDSLAQKGVDLDRYEMKPTHATNPSKDPFKIGADRDVTYSIYDKKTGQWVRDVTAGKVQEVYNDEFYRAAHGTRPASAKEAAEFAQKMDQQCVDALHKEAYGRGPADLKTALHEPGAKFRDPTQVGKAVAYKSHEWYEKAENAMSAGKAVEAEKLMSEGFRQTTKQFDNMLVRRHGALAEAGAQGLKNIPERMQEAIGVLKSAEKGVSPVAIEQKLRELGYTSPRDVATHVGEYIEAMDKLRPPVKPTGGGVGLRDIAGAAQTIASAAPNQQQQQ